MKKTVTTLLICILAVGLALFLGTGFITRTDVVLTDYTLSEDGSRLTFTAGVAGSMGYIRDCRVEEKGDVALVHFYCAFGGLNSSIGAKNTFTVTLPAGCTQVAFPRTELGFQVVLEQGADGLWQPPP